MLTGLSYWIPCGFGGSNRVDFGSWCVLFRLVLVNSVFGVYLGRPVSLGLNL